MAELKLAVDTTRDGRLLAVAFEEQGTLTVVQTVEVVDTKEEALAWFKKVSVTQPWRPRS